MAPQSFPELMQRPLDQPPGCRRPEQTALHAQLPLSHQGLWSFDKSRWAPTPGSSHSQPSSGAVTHSWSLRCFSSRNNTGGISQRLLGRPVFSSCGHPEAGRFVVPSPVPPQEGPHPTAGELGLLPRILPPCPKVGITLADKEGCSVLPWGLVGPPIRGPPILLFLQCPLRPLSCF